MSSKPRIGFIGVGLMGHGMAKNILEAGYPLTIMGHTNRKPVTDLVKRGAKEAKTASALAKESDVIFLCVTSSAQVEELVRGKTGIMAGAAKGAIIVDTSTSDPTSTVALAKELKAIGVKLIDAPLGRTPREAQEGRLNTFVGSDAKTLKEVRPIIETWAENIIHVGPVGNGHKIKLINNFIAMSYSAIWAEAYTACLMTGVDQKTLYNVVKAGGMYCGNFENMSKWVIGRDPKAHEFAIRNCLKDQRYFNNMIEAAGMAAVVAPSVKQSYALAVAKGDGDRHMPMMSDVVGELNGLKFPK
jgi:3-hydroxyisobutyrate dehydrogenase-like beta-hydroxyacid dehydrogenase